MVFSTCSLKNKCTWVAGDLTISARNPRTTWSRSYKKKFMLNSTEYEFLFLLINVKMPTLLAF